jgi:hypothetical protein
MVIIFEYGSSSTGMTVTSNLSGSSSSRTELLLSLYLVLHILINSPAACRLGPCKCCDLSALYKILLLMLMIFVGDKLVRALSSKLLVL